MGFSDLSWRRRFQRRSVRSVAHYTIMNKSLDATGDYQYIKHFALPING